MEDPLRRQEIKSSLKSIVEIADRWLVRLRSRQKRVRLVSSFLTMILVFFGILILGAATIFLGNSPNLPQDTSLFPVIFRAHQNEFFSFVGAAFLAAPISGVATYFLLRRRHDAQLKELSSLTAELKKIEVDQQQRKSNGGGQGITWNALSLADKIVTLLPKIVRKRNQDSLLFGVVAFLLTTSIGQNAAVGILVGAMVWLYFRYETRKTYDQEISKFEEQKRVFEQRKKDFLETL